jgi:hypothetical protein
MTKMLVDGGAAVNVMPYATYRKLGKGMEDLTKTDMMLKDFESKGLPARGATNVELIIGSKTLPTNFFIINGKGSYNLLLGQDWSHANYFMPSTMHHPMVGRCCRSSTRRFVAQHCNSRSSSLGI